MGLKDSPNQIQELLLIFHQPHAVTFAVIQMRSGKWDIYLDEFFFSFGDLPQREYFSWWVFGPWLVISRPIGQLYPSLSRYWRQAVLRRKIKCFQSGGDT